MYDISSLRVNGATLMTCVRRISPVEYPNIWIFVNAALN